MQIIKLSYLKESGDGSENLEDVEDAGYGELLIVEVGIDWDVAEHVGRGTATEDLDGAECVEHYGVDLAVLDIVDGTLTEGNDVAVIDLRLHGVASDVAPDRRLLEAWHYDVTGGHRRLAVDDLAETSKKIHIEVWFSLPDFLRDPIFFCIFVTGYRSPISGKRCRNNPRGDIWFIHLPSPG